jgi:hypothetical protein
MDCHMGVCTLLTEAMYMIYNDAYGAAIGMLPFTPTYHMGCRLISSVSALISVPLCPLYSGSKHPSGFGKPLAEVFPELIGTVQLAHRSVTASLCFPTLDLSSDVLLEYH